MKRIAIIGGGACGMFGAVCAKRAGADVVLLEHTDQMGKKLSATGNGKCNLTNLVLKPGDYRGNHPSFAVPVLKSFTQHDTMRLFEEMGLVLKEINGLVYPYSNQASTVSDLLCTELERLQVQVRTNIEIEDIIPDAPTGFVIKTNQGKVKADCVILACGSKAAPKTGSDGSGYQLAKKLGHSVIEPLPALVQLKAEGSCFKMIAGVRSDCRLKLYIEDKVFEEYGEVQFTDYGISGIPVFQFSRFAVRALWEKKKAYVVCDFLPQMEEEDLYKYLVKKQKRLAGHGSCEELLLGLLNRKLNLMLLKECGLLARTEAGGLTENNLKKLCRLMKQWKIPLKGYNSFEQGQICQGGIATKELTRHLESKIHKGLYFAGEIIDIDGRCGGYNLQWAWSSAYVAASHAAAETKAAEKVLPDGRLPEKEKRNASNKPTKGSNTVHKGRNRKKTE